jgi:hypothetical protein
MVLTASADDIVNGCGKMTRGLLSQKYFVALALTK